MLTLYWPRRELSEERAGEIEAVEVIPRDQLPHPRGAGWPNEVLIFDGPLITQGYGTYLG